MTETKDIILSILLRDPGRFISGEEIADNCGLSRASIWKYINILRDEGHFIEGKRNCGYRILVDNDILSSAGIGSYCKDPLPYRIYVYPSVTSTNDVLKTMALSGAKEGTVVAAGEQTAGRGRRNRQFFSPAKTGVYFSFLLRPKFDAETATLITAAAAVAAARGLDAVYQTSTSLKWVNDLFLGGKKIGGVLTEASLALENHGFDYIIVGIGINLQSPSKGFPGYLANIATAVDEGSSGVLDGRNRVIAAILDAFFDIYPRLAKREFMEEYRKRLFFLGEDVTVDGPGRQVVRALDVTENGHLIVVDAAGEEKILHSGEISIKTGK